MKTTLILISLLTLVSCGAAKKVYHTKVNIHPDAQDYVATFESKSGIHIKDLEVTFSDQVADGIMGYCKTGSRTETKPSLQGPVDHIYATPQVVLNSKYWYSGVYATPADREELVYHELGHCIIGRPHSTSQSSIMYPYHSNGGFYESNYASLIAELFSKPVSSFAGLEFDDSEYAASRVFPEFEEVEVVVPSADEIKDCVHDTGHTVTVTTEDEVHNHEAE